MATHAKSANLGDVMSSPVITVGHSATVAEAARVMRGSNVGSVVVTRAQAIAGIFTERDLVRAAAAGVEASRSLVRAWMTTVPFSLPSSTTLDDALETLRSRQHRRLPVVDEGRLVGIVSLSDFVRAGV